MTSFVHAADIHLDSPLRGLLPYEGAPSVEEIRGATRQALDNLVNFTISEQVPLLLIAGDLYDCVIWVGPSKMPNWCGVRLKTGVFFGLKPMFSELNSAFYGIIP